MKLLTVLMLIALPLSCFAGSGCTILEEVIGGIISPEVDNDQMLEKYQEFIDDEPTEIALKEMKEYFLKQDAESLNNIQVIMETISNSVWCAEY